jgi:phosphatidylserine/phosphatidylglycerophosphate/cardiolipin synthase-like enzyme
MIPIDETPLAAEFGIDLDRKPELDLTKFSGAHDVRAAVSPDCSFELLKDFVELAQSELIVYIYNVSAPHILNLLAAAKQRGVAIRIMYDAKDTAGDEVKKLKDLKVELKVAPSRDPRRIFDVCHQKFAVADGKVVLFGSANWAESSIPNRLPGKKRRKGNREWLLRIDDKPIARWYRTLFEADWQIPEIGGAPSFEIEAIEATRVAVPFDPPLDLPVKHFSALSGSITPLVSPDNYFAEVKKIIDGAKKRVYVQQQYIKGGASAPSIDKLCKSVAARAAAGVEVRIIVSSRFASGWSSSKDTMKAHGLIDKLKAINLDTFVHCHNKGVIADDNVVVSSTNWSENSVRRAREAGALIKSKDLGLYFASAFDDDWENGWSVAEGDAGPSFDQEKMETEGAEVVEIHPADAE